MNNELEVTQPLVQPADVLAGLGAADRRLLSASLSLFEDSTLSRRLAQIYKLASDEVIQRIGKAEVREDTEHVQTRIAYWLECDLSDNELRLILWVYLREAFGLPARLSISLRGTAGLADDLAAAAIHAVDPPGVLRSGKDLLHRCGFREDAQRRVTLSDVVLPLLDDLLSTALKEGPGEMDAAAQRQLIREVRSRLEQMNADDQQRMLESVGANELNDAAIRNILLSGGGLAAFSTSVGITGFSAYILAAQASAFIPMVSGPALVSFVSVLSNPVTVIVATGAALWWFTGSAVERVRTEVGIRVLALLALQGLDAGRTAMEQALKSFEGAAALKSTGDLDCEMVERYRREWMILEPTVGKVGTALDPHIKEVMNRPATEEDADSGRLGRLLFPNGDLHATAVVAALTVGDVAYSAAAIDPMVIQAADFARVDILDDPLAFANFAKRIMELAPAGTAGAVNNIKGYVAEQLVAAELVRHGHQISFPDTSNEPGWDLLVDGQKFQVKCLADGVGLKEHFDKYDYPVLVNAELSDQIPSEWADRVFFVEGYSEELVEDVTEWALEAGAEVLDPNVPIFALGVSAARNLWNYRVGKVSATQAMEQLVLDGVSRTGLAALGGYVGTGIGLLVFGPAGGLVFGVTIPVLAQAQARRVQGVLDQHTQTDNYRRWSNQSLKAVNDLVSCLNRILEEKVQYLREKYGSLGVGGVSSYVRYRLEDEARYLRESRARLAETMRADGVTVEQRALNVLRWTASSTVHPARYQTELMSLRQNLDQRPGLMSRLREHASEVAGAAEKFRRDIWEIIPKF